MLLIGETFNPSINSHVRYKAPRNKMYLINNIFMNPIGTASQTLFILDYAVDDAVTTQNPRTALASISHGIVISYSFSNLNHKTKYITIIANGTSAAQAFIAIYGDIVSASKVDLIWEWFRKGR